MAWYESDDPFTEDHFGDLADDAGPGHGEPVSELTAFWRGVPESTLRRAFGDDWDRAAALRDEFPTPSVRTQGGWGQVQARFGSDGPTVSVLNPVTAHHRITYCTCRQTSCLHGALAVRALREGWYRVDWRPALAPVLDTRPDRSAVTPERLGIRVVVERRSYGSPLTVTVAPGRRTKKGAWAKNYSWSNALGPTGRRAMTTDQLAVVLGLFPFDDTRYAYQTVELGHLDHGWWDLLDRVEQAGLELDLDGDGEPLVIRRDAPLQIIARGTFNGDTLVMAGDLELPPGATPTAVHLFGSPTHAALLETTSGWELHPVASDALATALLRAGTVEIPGDEVEDFTQTYLSRVEPGRLHLISDIDPEDIRLVAHLRSRGVEGASLTWRWHYPSSARGTTPLNPRYDPQQSPPAERTYGFAPALSPGRDLDAEQQLRRDLLADIDGLEGILGARTIELDPVEACRFGITVQPQLEQHRRAGVVVEGDSVEWTAAESAELDWDVEGTDDRDWFDLSIRLVVDGVEVELRQLLPPLVHGAEYLVLGSGTYVDLTTEPMQQLKAFLEECADLADPDQVRINRYRIDLWERLQELGELRAQAEEWRESAARRTVPDTSDLPVPDGVRAELRPYQVTGYRWLVGLWQAGLGAVLADDMGLGKTLQVLCAIRHQKDHGANGPVLVAVPRSVLATWRDQAAQFVPDLNVRVISQRLKGNQILDEGVDVVITSHQLLRLDAEEYGAEHWSAVVIDEAQAAKNPTSALHRAIRRLDRDFTLAVTGTPLENSLLDLWAIMALVAPGLFGELSDFTKDLRRPIESGDAPELLDRVRRRIRPLLLRRTKNAVATELPEKSEDTVRIDLTSEHAREYRQLLNKERQRILGLLDVDANRHRIEILAGLTRLRLLAATPGEVEKPSAKATELIDRVTELAAEGHRVLVFGQFTTHLQTMRDQLKGAGIASEYLDGGTRNREAVIDRFRGGDVPAFLISLKAGGVGITLTEADYVIITDPWWNPAAESQAIDRTHRIGQTRPVTVYRLVSADTIEEKVVALQENKRKLFSSLLDDGEWQRPLDADEIRGLLLDSE